MRIWTSWAVMLVATIGVSFAPLSAQTAKPRARDLGIRPGILEPGRLNAITDVEGVRVGHTTVVSGDRVRTGVTAILPHGGNLFQEKVAGAVFVGNAFGKLAGSTQVRELGTIETPIVLTNTLAVGTAVEAVVDWTLRQPGNEQVRSVNALVGETNDGRLNDIRTRSVTREHVWNAIASAATGRVPEGGVGAGTGTVAFGWKGGIGTASRRTGAYTVGVLVQSNYGGILTVDGVPVGKALRPQRPVASASPARRKPLMDVAAEAGPAAPKPLMDVAAEAEPATPKLLMDAAAEAGPATPKLLMDAAAEAEPAAPKPLVDLAAEAEPATPKLLMDAAAEAEPAAPKPLMDVAAEAGSCMIVVATDAPLTARDLERLAARAVFGLARTGSSYSNGSGDYAIAFSTSPETRMRHEATEPKPHATLPTDGVSGLFEAVLEATEEAVYNSLLQAETTTANGVTVEALPLEQLRALMKKYGRE